MSKIKTEILENISGYIEEYKREYPGSSYLRREVYTSEFNSFESSGASAGAGSRIINGGRKLIYTAAMFGMLNAGIDKNAYGFTASVGGGAAASVVNNEVMGSGHQYIYSGGMANSGILNKKGYQHISSGASALNTKINGGSQHISSGGSALATVINSGGQHVSSGGYTSGSVINSNGSQNISSGGSAAGTMINFSGHQHIFPGGSALNTKINGGNQEVESGGSASDTVINSGGQYVYEGGSSTNVVQNSGGNINASAARDSVNISTYISGINASGKTVTLISGAASNFILYSGGKQDVDSGGSAFNTEINYGGFQSVVNSGSALNTVINSGGYQHVSSGGSSINVVQNSGGNINADMVSGLTDISTYVSGINASGKTVTLISGVASNFILYSGGYQDVTSNGSAFNTEINNGGSQYVTSNGSALNTVINSGGDQYVNNGGRAINVIQNSGGNINVHFGNISTYVSGINASGKTVTLISGVASNFILYSGGRQEVYRNGSAFNTEVNNGGNQYIYAGAYVSGTVINSGGYQGISSGAYVSGTVIKSGGKQNVFRGGSAFNTEINGGDQYVAYNASALNTKINGGYQYISLGAYASGTVIKSGYQTLFSGGSALKTEINGGYQHIYSGACASDTVINSGGQQNVSSGASALNTKINYGEQLVYSGASVSATVMNGGYQIILSGGSVADTVINGGYQLIQSSASALNTINSGGEVTLAYAGKISGYSGANSGVINIYHTNTLYGQTSLTNGAVINIDSGYWNGPRTVEIENLNGGGGIVKMAVDLKEQNGDKLKITGSYKGGTLISLSNTAAGADRTTGNGIKLVEFTGSGVNGSFGLTGGKWDEGGYEYGLYKGDLSGMGADYYLRDTGKYSDTFKTMLNMPVMNSIIAMTGMNSLEKRLGDLRRMQGKKHTQGIWARNYGKELKIKDFIESEMNVYGFEAGYDYEAEAAEGVKGYIGVMGGYAKSWRIKTKQSNGMYSQGEGESPSAGIYAAVLGENGWFMDLAARHFWTKLDMKNYAADGTELAYKPKRGITAVSLEGGKEFIIGGGKGQWKIEPKGEIMYMKAAGGKAEVKGGTGYLEYDDTDYISMRAAVTAGYIKKRSNGLLAEPYAEIGYRYEFDGRGDIRYGGAKEESNLRGGRLEGALGLDWQFTNDMYVYGQIMYETGKKEEGYGGNIGIRYAFGGGNKKEENKKKNKEAEAETSGAAKEILSAPLEYGKEISLEGAHFKHASAELSEEFKRELERKAEELKGMEYTKISIIGHTDSSGSDGVNDPLSRRRAGAAAEYLIINGVEREKTEYWGEGSRKPAARNDTKEGRERNRRVEIEVFNR